jgi:sialidase-1
MPKPVPVPVLSRRSLIVTTTATLAVLASALPAAAASGTSGATGATGAGPTARRRGASEPFVSGTEGYDTFRIPAVLTTPSGTVLAFAEGRVGGSSDTGDIDVVVKRSRDGGRTWGPLILVAKGDGDVRGNPAPVIDPATGRLVLLTCYNAGDATEAEITAGLVPAEDSRRVFVQFSEDDGRSFSEPREITADVKRPDCRPRGRAPAAPGSAASPADPAAVAARPARTGGCGR